MRPKSLLLAPYRLAIALEEAGWILRDRVVWWKTNSAGESVHDRFHVRDEVLLRFTPERFAYFDEAAVRVPLSPASIARRGRRAPTFAGPKAAENSRSVRPGAWHSPGREDDKANPGNVWPIASANLAGRRFSHTAMFPPELIRRPILATVPPGGVVLDPFAGTGTTAEVANSLLRRAVLIELDPAAIDMIRVRCEKRPIVEVPA